MDEKGYQKLATKCEKHIRGLSIALDGVVKAESAGQASLITASVRGADRALTKVIDCMGYSGDAQLLEPLHRMREALEGCSDGERVSAIERDLHEFRNLLDARLHHIVGGPKKLAYSGNALA